MREGSLLYSVADVPLRAVNGLSHLLEINESVAAQQVRFESSLSAPATVAAAASAVAAACASLSLVLS